MAKKVTQKAKEPTHNTTNKQIAIRLEKYNKENK